jgi:hypothetical protein
VIVREVRFPRRHFVGDVAAGQVQGHRQAPALGDQVELGGEPSPGAAEGLPLLRLLRIDRPAVVPLFRAPRAAALLRRGVEGGGRLDDRGQNENTCRPPAHAPWIPVAQVGEKSPKDQQRGDSPCLHVLHDPVEITSQGV